ncbi:hypothetical protein J22TS1_04760 [Siminovitchia terrae]|uniref:SAR2788 family putative toxin n=1 Tax=Siminovitchia terrae TaxID=1914933 RepID=UPI001B02C65B|nr:SAR2788 family putative toxin [Siminovitchia terrae]GIN89425.1 hypothetical protein J22TS1_04760 [Siminovitchia terrae]
MYKQCSIKQIIAVLLSLLLMVGLLPNGTATAQETDIVQEVNDSVIVESNDEELVVKTDIEFEENVPTNEATEEPVSEEIKEAEVALSINYETNEITLESVEMDTEGSKVVKEYKVDVETANDEEIVATFTDVNTNKEYNIDTKELQASVAFLIPVGVVIGEALLAHLISIGLATVIGGVAYIAISEFLKKKKTKNHYAAAIVGKKLFIGFGLSHKSAASRLKKGKDTWSTSKNNAKSVAKAGSPIKKIIGPEVDKKGAGKVYHYHPIKGYNKGKAIKIGSHAFYGAPR